MSGELKTDYYWHWVLISAQGVVNRDQLIFPLLTTKTNPHKTDEWMVFKKLDIKQWRTVTPETYLPKLKPFTECSGHGTGRRNIQGPEDSLSWGGAESLGRPRRLRLSGKEKRLQWHRKKLQNSEEQLLRTQPKHWSVHTVRKISQVWRKTTYLKGLEEAELVFTQGYKQCLFKPDWL